MAEQTGILTFQEIINQGLEMGGNPALGSPATGGLAHTFLNLFLDSLYRGRDWEFLIDEGTFTISAGTALATFTPSTPGDYRAIREIHIDGDISSLSQEDYRTLWRKIRVDTENGTTADPTHFAVKEGIIDAEIYVWPIPKKSATGDALYYRQPAQIAAGGTLPDPLYTDKPVFPDHSTLVAAVADFSASYDRDTMQQILQRNLDGSLSVSTSNIGDMGRKSPQKLKFDPTVYGIWRGDG